ncbi:MAG: WGR domain-containing protein [Halomonadaceae bacterium]|nr:WGR domain-containing protein [Halomonadaceae bacterium]
MKITLHNNGTAGLKMWEAEVSSQSVTIRYGTVGKKPRTQIIPLAACINNSAMEEAIKRANAKRKKGYWDVEQQSATTPPRIPTEPKSVTVATGALGSHQSNEWF